MRIYLPDYEALLTIDDEDLPLFGAYRWHVRGRGRTRYVSRSDDGKTVFLHRDIMKPSGRLVVDHIDGDGLNNSRSNLRIVTHQQNLWNRTRQEGGIGVYFQASRQKWRATIDHNGRKLELGAFDSEELARSARDVAARLLRGDIATQNDRGADYSGFNPVHFSPTARRLLLKVIA